MVLIMPSLQLCKVSNIAKILIRTYKFGPRIKLFNPYAYFSLESLTTLRGTQFEKH